MKKKKKKKKRERDRFIKKLDFEPATFRVIGEPSPDWAMGAVSVPAEN